MGGVLDGFQCLRTNFDSSFCTCIYIYSGRGFKYTAETKRATTFVFAMQLLDVYSGKV